MESEIYRLDLLVSMLESSRFRRGHLDHDKLAECRVILRMLEGKIDPSAHMEFRVRVGCIERARDDGDFISEKEASWNRAQRKMDEEDAIHDICLRAGGGRPVYRVP